jgi:DNA polymerase-3 subunit delta
VSDDLEDALQDLEAGGESPVYFLAGEEFLVRKAAERLITSLVPGGAADLNLVTMDAATPRDVVAELATIPMFGGRKVVLCRDPEFLAPKKGRGDALGRARDAWKANKRKEGARRVLALAAKAGWGVDELDLTKPSNPKPADWDSELGIALAEVDVAFLKEVQAFCIEEGIAGPSGDDAMLNEWLGKQAQKGQVLVVAATDFDAKHPFVKLAKEKGTFLEFRVASRLKDLDLGEFVTETLTPYKKKLGPGALELLKDRVGGNFRLLQSELTKLALYSDTATISSRDVDLLVRHGREDEYFELSEAVQKRNLELAVKFVNDGVTQGNHPIMMLGSIAGIVRTMLMNFERMAALSDGKPPRSYQDFQARIWPKIEAETKAAKTKLPHPYAAFMGMQAAAGYGRQELLRGLVSCAEADLALKLGGDKLVLERLLWTLCGKAAAWESGMHLVRRENER